MPRKKVEPKLELLNPKASKKEIISQILTKKTKEKFLTENQREYYNLIQNKEITICSGPSGVGKSYIAIKCALDMLGDPKTPYTKLVIIRPAIESEERLGSLPGGVSEKIDPYIFPSYYLMSKIIGKEAREKLKDNEIVEAFAIAYMRGMNIDNTILVCEEAQNLSNSQLKLVLTRIGYNSKFIISGDLEQSDKFRNKKDTGLWHAINKFSDVPEIGVFEFGQKDIVRNPIITLILNKYE